jgi:hypothetical protein
MLQMLKYCLRITSDAFFLFLGENIRLGIQLSATPSFSPLSNRVNQEGKQQRPRWN